jgi:hypothetical protein
MKKYNVLKSNQKWFKNNNLNLDDAFEEITIMEADEAPENNVTGWYAVVDTDGINAYFSTETEALAYRLFLINRILNN